eukprot:scaffold5350_cov54-Cylindrotheca_fusiformis.AAC.1
MKGSSRTAEGGWTRWASWINSRLTSSCRWMMRPPELQLRAWWRVKLPPQPSQDEGSCNGKPYRMSRASMNSLEVSTVSLETLGRTFRAAP